MIIKSSNPSSITRSDIWIKGHTRKNGEPTNVEVGETMKQIQEIKDNSFEDSSTSLKDDALSQVLGPEPSGHVRALGFEAGLRRRNKATDARINKRRDEGGNKGRNARTNQYHAELGESAHESLEKW
ncbi:hypothetical protein FRX31_034467 [Thalictrum thalictroides]|uniref:Uncharacterized protein n=1 Tax=Thalictrum thalictroides TaxID=46969 RepID=A0A7J6UTP9_THATH|nr:hypothetical protein FRX31_034467 [Thalictrum thalictroides]